jgi:hypothetical protein
MFCSPVAPTGLYDTRPLRVGVVSVQTILPYGFI